MPIDPTYFNNVKTQISTAGSCEALQAIAADVKNAIAEQEAAIAAQIAKLAPMLALLSVPTNPGQLLTWAANVIEHLITPIVAPYYLLTADLVQLTAELAAVLAAIEDALPKFPSCSVL